MSSGTSVAACLLLLVSAFTGASANDAAASDDGYHPFTNFGKSTPGYKAPKVGHPFTEFGKMSPPAVVSADPDDDSDTGADADSNDGPDSDEDSPDETAPAPAPVPGAKAPVDERGRPIDVEREDAEANFHTLIEAFIAKNKVGDCWPVKEDKRDLCLDYLSADTRHLKKRRAGIYSGVIVLRDKAKDVNVAAEATVDFSGEHWTILGLRFLGRKSGVLKHPFSWSVESLRRPQEETVSVTVIPDVKKSSAAATASK